METTSIYWSRALEVLAKFKKGDGSPKYPNAHMLFANEVLQALADEADHADAESSAWADLLDNAERQVDRLTHTVEALKATVRAYAAGVAELRIEIALAGAADEAAKGAS